MRLCPRSLLSRANRRRPVPNSIVLHRRVVLSTADRAANSSPTAQHNASLREPICARLLRRSYALLRLLLNVCMWTCIDRSLRQLFLRILLIHLVFVLCCVVWFLFNLLAYLITTVHIHGSILNHFRDLFVVQSSPHEREETGVHLD